MAKRSKKEERCIHKVKQKQRGKKRKVNPWAVCRAAMKKSK